MAGVEFGRQQREAGRPGGRGGAGRLPVGGRVDVELLADRYTGRDIGVRLIPRDVLVAPGAGIEARMIVTSHPLRDGVLRVEAAGEIDMATVDTLAKALHDAAQVPGVAHIVVDLDGVTFCDSSGVAALDEGYGAAQRRGITLRVVNLQRPVARVFELTGLLSLTDPNVNENI